MLRLHCFTQWGRPRWKESMHPLNYARGLLDEFAGAVRVGNKAHKALVVAELKLVQPLLVDFDVSDFGDDVAAMKTQALADVAAILGIKSTTK